MDVPWVAGPGEEGPRGEWNQVGKARGDGEDAEEGEEGEASARDRERSPPSRESLRPRTLTRRTPL